MQKKIGRAVVQKTCLHFWSKQSSETVKPQQTKAPRYVRKKKKQAQFDHTQPRRQRPLKSWSGGQRHRLKKTKKHWFESFWSWIGFVPFCFPRGLAADAGRPCFPPPSLPTLLCQPCFANPAWPTLLGTLLGQPCLEPCLSNPHQKKKKQKKKNRNKKNTEKKNRNKKKTKKKQQKEKQRKNKEKTKKKQRKTEKKTMNKKKRSKRKTKTKNKSVSETDTITSLCCCFTRTICTGMLFLQKNKEKPTKTMKKKNNRKTKRKTNNNKEQPRKTKKTKKKKQQQRKTKKNKKMKKWKIDRAVVQKTCLHSWSRQSSETEKPEQTKAPRYVRKKKKKKQAQFDHTQPRRQRPLKSWSGGKRQEHKKNKKALIWKFLVVNLFCTVLFSARSGGDPAFQPLLCQPSFAKPPLPDLLGQPCLTNPAWPTLLCQPCFANPLLSPRHPLAAGPPRMGHPQRKQKY